MFELGPPLPTQPTAHKARTVGEMFWLRVARSATRPALYYKERGRWETLTWAQTYERAASVAKGLYDLGLERGDRVAVLGPTQPPWAIYDLGAQLACMVSFGIYPKQSPEQVRYLLEHSEARAIFVADPEELETVLAAAEGVDSLKAIVPWTEALCAEARGRDPRVISPKRFEGEKLPESEVRELWQTADPNDTAIFIYTSGTTGPPKGAMISHENIISSIAGAVMTLPVDQSDEQLCFLPLCHILERLISVFTPIGLRSTVNFAESPETVFDNVREVSPHVFTAVPRVWEKVYSRVTIMANEATPLGKWAFKRAIAAGMARGEALENGDPVPLATRLSYAFWDFMVLQNLRRLLGFDRLRRGTTGAAPISPALLKWYRAVGITLLEGYGMTESSGVISVNLIEKNKTGTVGQVVPGGEMRISPEGEIQYRAPNVFKGYWNKPDKTAETIDEDGWLRTGDVGRIDNEGFLTITGRVKDIIITAGGKNITPAEIENRLKFSPYVSDAVVIGDKRKYLSCLIMIDQENVEKFAQDRRVPFNDFKSLCAAQEVRDLIGGVVAETNAEFARVEQIKDFRLIDVLLTAEDEELTATMKLKRSFVEQKHKKLIDEMYGQPGHAGN